MSHHEEIEPADGPDYCKACGITLGIGLHMVAEAHGLPGVCIECASEGFGGQETDDSGAEEGHMSMGDSDSYRDAMIGSGRGHLLS